MDNKDSKDNEIIKLQNRRFNLREKIRSYYEKNKNAYDLVVEFHDVINKLKSLGYQADVRKEYLQLEYWENFQKNQKPTTIIQDKPEEKQNDPKQKDSYFLYLAWTELYKSKTPIQIQKVKDYFNELGMSVEDESVKNIDDNHKEYILRYNFEGSEDSFRMLKLCTQFVLDTFAESDFDKFNIAVYGKKKNY